MEFTIKQAADLVGLTSRALRYYESVGLLIKPERSRGNYRLYTTADLVDLLRIKRWISLGFSLTQIKEILNDPANETARQKLDELDAELSQRQQKIEEQRQEITRIKNSGTTLDVPLEYAALLTRLQEANLLTADEPVEKMRLELIAALGSEKDKERLQALLAERVDLADSPEHKALKDLDARFESIGPDSSDAELTSLIKQYIDALSIVFARQNAGPPFDLAMDLNSLFYNEEQVQVMTAVMQELRQRLAAEP
jgi:DNA-binding transcriptional MerR regulator